jgi:hypothetical protein
VTMDLVKVDHPPKRLLKHPETMTLTYRPWRWFTCIKDHVRVLFSWEMVLIGYSRSIDDPVLCFFVQQPRCLSFRLSTK